MEDDCTPQDVLLSAKLIHLDLKGAPPKISYLKELLPLLKKHGATGLLVEYEDTFPYKEHLQHLRKLPDDPTLQAKPKSETPDSVPTKSGDARNTSSCTFSTCTTTITPSSKYKVNYYTAGGATTISNSHVPLDDTRISTNTPTSTTSCSSDPVSASDTDTDGTNPSTKHLNTGDTSTNTIIVSHVASDGNSSNTTDSSHGTTHDTGISNTSVSDGNIHDTNTICSGHITTDSTTEGATSNISSCDNDDNHTSEEWCPYYSEAEVAQLLACAEENQLEVIPLVQTFGHVEFMLKHNRHRGLRESARFPNALCPRAPGSFDLVRACVEQVLALHPRARYIHLGMDEVLVGACERCSGGNRGLVYLEWAARVCGWLRREHPTVTPIIWDDMMRDIPAHQLEGSGVGELTAVMVWKYDAGQLVFPKGYLTRLCRVFSKTGVWVASAYKGASGSTQCLVPVQSHVDNHLAWLRVLASSSDLRACFKGFALTGWQRYDHASALCELLPAAVPCLALCLAVLSSGSFTHAIHARVSSSLGFASLLNLCPLTRPQEVQAASGFPGHELFVSLQVWSNFLASLTAVNRSELMAGWFNAARRRLHLVSPGALGSLLPQFEQQMACVREIYALLRRDLLVVYDQHSTQEWLSCYVDPVGEQITEHVTRCRALLMDSACGGCAPHCRCSL